MREHITFVNVDEIKVNLHLLHSLVESKDIELGKADMLGFYNLYALTEHGRDELLELASRLEP